jgi:hypothetical protein
MKCNKCKGRAKKDNVYCLCDCCLMEAVDYAKLNGWRV